MTILIDYLPNLARGGRDKKTSLPSAPALPLQRAGCGATGLPWRQPQTAPHASYPDWAGHLPA